VHSDTRANALFIIDHAAQNVKTITDLDHPDRSLPSL